MAARRSTPGMTRKNLSTGWTGWTCGTVIASAMFRDLRSSRDFSPGNVLEHSGAHQKRGEEGRDDGPRVQRQVPAISEFHFCTHGHAPCCSNHRDVLRIAILLLFLPEGLAALRNAPGSDAAYDQ